MTKREWDIVESVQLRVIMKSFYEHSLNLFMSRNLKRAIKEMKAKIT